jgi:hypothetical protein
MSRGQTPATGARANDARAADYQRSRLATAMAVSAHTLVPGSAFAAAAKRVGLAILCFLLCVPAMAGTVTVLRQNRFDSAVWGVGFTALLFGLGLWLVSSAMSRYTGAVSEAEICHDGLRWRIGAERTMALWSDIADVDVSMVKPTTGGGLAGAARAWNATPRIDQVRIRLHSGEALVIRAGALTDFVRFAHEVQSRHQETIQSAQHGGRGDAYDALSRW